MSRDVPARALVVVLAVTALLVPVSPATEAGAAVCHDALVSRVLDELRTFTGWLDEHGVDGVIGEVGWPDAQSGDAERWNGLADAWFRDADAARLWVTTWATGEWWGSYPLAVYGTDESGALAVANTQAAVLERHLDLGGTRRGVNVAGGEFGTPGPLDQESSFSNADPGTYGTSHQYDGAASFGYLAGRGIEVVRLPFRWERIQRSLGGPLDPTELGHLSAAVDRAHGAGLGVILDVHNYGAYWLWDGERGVRRPIGSAEVSIEDFADLWRRLAGRFRDHPGVLGYGLMNEPVELAASGGLEPVRVWERASQAALDAIRATDDRTTVLVGGYQWSGAQRWDQVHARPWIHDRLDAVRYEAHHYWDRTNAGHYPHRYAEEVADAEGRGYGPACAEAVRVAGADRVATAIAAARHGWTRSERVVVARSDDPADALAGTALAGKLDAPLLVTPPGELHPDVAAEVGRLGARRAWLLGGEQALSPAVARGLEAAGVARVDRVAGPTRVETAVSVAEHLTPTADTALLVRGLFPEDPARSWVDALAVSGLAARRAAAGQAWPVLVTDDVVPGATWSALSGLGIRRVVVVGGTLTVPPSVDDALRAAGYQVERLAGATRFATSLEAVRRDLALAGGSGPLLAATAAAFPDGLSAGPLAARVGGALLLVPTAEPDDEQMSWLATDGRRFTGVVVVGGPVAVSEVVASALVRSVGS